MNTPTQGELPIKLLKPSPHNPRKTMDEAGLQGLADSFRQVGILQPLTVRPVGKSPKLIDGEWQGVDHFQIVAGHRRYAAAKLAKLQTVPVSVREMTDDEAETVMAIENDQREDVKPSEQAVAYKRLADKHGLEETAKRVGRPLSAVRELVRLSALPAWFLVHVDSGLVSRAVAAVVSRVPGAESRERAAFDVLTDGDYRYQDQPELAAIPKLVAECMGSEHFRGPMTVREAKEFIVDNYSRELKSAPFPRKSLDLVEDARDCDSCPKRAGNDPVFVAEGVRADVCTDTDCYSRKVAAWGDRTRLKAAEEGKTVLPASETDKLFPYGTRLDGGSQYLDLETTCFEDSKSRNYNQILKPQIKAGVLKVTVAFDGEGKPHQLVDKKDATESLKDHGIKKQTSSGDESWKKQQAAEKKKAEIGKIALTLALDGVVKTAEHSYRNIVESPSVMLILLRSLAQVVPSCLWNDSARVVARRRGIEGSEFTEQLRNFASNTDDPAVLFGFIAEFIATKVAGGYGACLDGHSTSNEQKEFDRVWGLDRKKLLADAKIAKEEKKAKPKVSLLKAAKAASFETIDDLLKHCLCHHTQGDEDKWSELRASGGTDAAIYAVLKTLWSQGGQSGLGYEATFSGGAAPTWFGRVGDKPGLALTGQRLTERVRLVLEIPQPKSEPGPLVCKPLGEGLLADIKGITAEDAKLLSAVGLRTLFDMEKKCDEVRLKHTNPNHYRPGIGSQTYEVLRQYPGVFNSDYVLRIGDAIMDHLGWPVPTPSSTTTKRKGKSK